MPPNYRNDDESIFEPYERGFYDEPKLCPVVCKSKHNLETFILKKICKSNKIGTSGNFYLIKLHRPSSGFFFNENTNAFTMAPCKVNFKKVAVKLKKTIEKGNRKRNQVIVLDMDNDLGTAYKLGKMFDICCVVDEALRLQRCKIDKLTYLMNA